MSGDQAVSFRVIGALGLGALLLLFALGCGLLQPASPALSTVSYLTLTPRPTFTPVPTLSASVVPGGPATPPPPVERGKIRPGEEVRGSLPLLGTEVWSFQAPAGRYLTIHMMATDPDALDTYLELRQADGLLLAEDDDGGRGTDSVIVEFPTVFSGTYTIHALTYGGAGGYSLSLSIDQTPVGGGGASIELGQSVEGSLLAPWSQHPWAIDGWGGQTVNVRMHATDGGLDCYLALYNPQGALLTDDDDSGPGYDALIEYYTFPVTGTYRIVARSGTFGPTGGYALSVEPAERVVLGELVYSDTVEAVLPAGTRHHWLFEGQAGDVIDVSMVALDEDMDTYLELFAPDGVRIAAIDDTTGTDARLLAFELPLSGIYRLIARGHADEDVGRYRLALDGP